MYHSILWGSMQLSFRVLYFHEPVKYKIDSSAKAIYIKKTNFLAFPCECLSTQANG